MAAVDLELPASSGAATAELLWLTLRLRLRGLRHTPRPASAQPAELARRLSVCWTAGFGLAGVAPLPSLVFVTRAALLALAAGDRARISVAFAVHQALLSAVRPIDVDRTLRRVAPLAEASGDPYARHMLAMSRGAAAYFRGELRRGIELLDGAERDLREDCRGIDFELVTLQSLANFCRGWIGEWADVCRRLPAQAREAEQRGDLYGAASLNLALGWIVSLSQDDAAAAEAIVDDYLARWGRQQTHYQHFYETLNRSRARMYRGEGRTALAMIDARTPQLASAGHFRVRVTKVLWLVLRVEALVMASYELAGSERAAALRRAERDLRLLARVEFVGARTAADNLRACWLLARGERDAAIAALRRVPAPLEAIEWKHYAASSGHLLGRLVGGDEGRELVARAEAALRAEGVKNPARLATLHAPGPPGP
jgi:hypothetical protein